VLAYFLPLQASELCAIIHTVAFPVHRLLSVLASAPSPHSLRKIDSSELLLLVSGLTGFGVRDPWLTRFYRGDFGLACAYSGGLVVVASGLCPRGA